MTLPDRILRSLFVACAVGLAWGIRGDFGGSTGAMYPGAILGLAFCYVAAQPLALRWMPAIALATGIFIGLGGMQSYGILHGYSMADTPINFTYGYFTLFLEGGAWGCFGCAMMGLLLSEPRPSWKNALLGAALVIATGIAFKFLVVDFVGFHVNPPRGDESVVFTGSVIALFALLSYARMHLARKAAFLGWIGWGTGMSFGRFLANASYHLPFEVNHWNIMEVSCGFIGGFVFTFGMLGVVFPAEPTGRAFRVFSYAGIAYTLAIIPLLHWEKILFGDQAQKWVPAFTGFGYPNPEGAASFVGNVISFAALAAIAAAFFWALLHSRRNMRWPWLPVVALSTVMVLIQQVNALHPWYPPYQGLNMHNVLLALYLVTLLFVAFYGLHGSSDQKSNPAQLNYLAYAALGLASFAVCIIGSFAVNGEKTMQSANTRWPVWAWTDGPYPGGVHEGENK